jgi:hypothetical protein
LFPKHAQLLLVKCKIVYNLPLEISIYKNPSNEILEKSWDLATSLEKIDVLEKSITV